MCSNDMYLGLQMSFYSFFLGHIADMMALQKESGNQFEPFANMVAKW